MRASILAAVFVIATTSSVGHAAGQTALVAADDSPLADSAQSASSSVSLPLEPITPPLRVRWLLDGAIGPESVLFVGPLSAAWSTAWNTPGEWGHSWPGFGKRYVEREADVAIANSIEAGLGALWGEDPRFIPSGKRGIWSRAGFAITSTFVAPARDGRLRPAWARYAAKTGKNYIENAWMPPSAHTTRQMLIRTAQGFSGRMLGNLWEEFWPDVRRRLRR